MLLVGPEFYRPLWWWRAKFRDFLLAVKSAVEIFFPRHLKLGLNHYQTTMPMSYFKCRTAVNLLSGNYSSCRNREPPSETRVLLTSREPENYSLTYSTFQCEMGGWKSVCISFELDQNLSSFSVPLTQHAFWDMILLVFFSFPGIKIQNHLCSSCLLYFGEKSRHE